MAVSPPHLPNPETGRPMPARTNDGIHMTIPGYTLLTRGLAAAHPHFGRRGAPAGRPARAAPGREPAPPRRRLARLMGLFLGLLVGWRCRCRISPRRPPPAMHDGAALAPFHARLRAPGRGPIHILQIGDSHTSADAISNGMRVPLQARFGNGGRGVLAAGRPYQNYVTWNVTASQSGGWTANSWTNSHRGVAPARPFRLHPDGARRGRDDRPRRRRARA